MCFLIRKSYSLITNIRLSNCTMPRIEVKNKTCQRITEITGLPWTKGGDENINLALDIKESQIKEASLNEFKE